MKKESRLKNGMDMLYLAACALHDEVPDSKRVSAMNVHGVMSEAMRHSMNGVTYLGIKKYAESLPNAPIGADADAMAGWKAGYVHIVRQTLLFAMEREKILSFFDRSGIWYAPMKDIILQNLYPQIGMRQIVDNDILFDGAYRKPQILPRLPSIINALNILPHHQKKTEPTYMSSVKIFD